MAIGEEEEEETTVRKNPVLVTKAMVKAKVEVAQVVVAVAEEG